jgi:serine/threonine-protein kinase HipA
MSELRVLIDETEIGSLFQEKGGQLRFVYDSEWRNRVDAIPLSLSMPLTGSEFGHKTVTPFLWNLLPDREATLRQIADEHGISARNPFALVGARGEDLQGAVQIVPSERIPHLRKRERIVRVSEAQLHDVLLNRMRATGATHVGEDSGFFSLAGAQPKMAVCLINGRWYEQRGYTPSTHILKPAMPDLKEQVENEHFCLKLGEAVGLPMVRSGVRTIGDLKVLLIERYDRVRIQGHKRLALTAAGGRVHRLHQEDMCSALSVHPEKKYQHLGGPGIKAVMQLLAGSGAPEIDRERFMRACAFNYVIAGIDAHAKNFSVLIEGGGRFRLARFYDVISALPYDMKTYSRLAMSVHGERRYTAIYPTHWEKLAAECRYDKAAAVEHVREYVAAIPDHAQTVLAACEQDGLRADIIRQLVKSLQQRCKALEETYDIRASA